MPRRYLSVIASGANIILFNKELGTGMYERLDWYGLNFRAPFPNSYVEVLTPNVMLFGGEIFES